MSLGFHHFPQEQCPTLLPTKKFLFVKWQEHIGQIEYMLKTAKTLSSNTNYVKILPAIAYIQPDERKLRRIR